MVLTRVKMVQPLRRGGRVQLECAAVILFFASSLLKNSKLSSERFCGERLVLNSITRVRE